MVQSLGAFKLVLAIGRIASSRSRGTKEHDHVYCIMAVYQAIAPLWDCDASLRGTTDILRSVGLCSAFSLWSLEVADHNRGAEVPEQ